MCEEDSAKTRSLEVMSNKEFSYFFMDDCHRIIYCYIPKVIQK